MLNLTYSREQLEELCRQYHVSKLSVFGSTLRGEAMPDSDLDLLVEFEAGKTPGYPFFTLQRELSAVFRKPVDLNTAGFLGRRFREEIIRDAKPIYAR
jgi:uncharacterized protein